MARGLWVAVLLAGLFSMGVEAQRQARCGRVDVYVAGSAFNLGQVGGTGLASVGYCGWLGEGKERSGVTCEKALGKDWEQVWVEFVAEGSGEVDIDLQGEWYGAEGADDVRVVWADDVEVTGVRLTNPGFEEADAEGRPAGWRFTGEFPRDRYERSGRVARSGQSCVGVWWGGQARQAFRVEAGRTYRVSAWFRVLDPSQVEDPLSVPLECPAEEYEQEVTLTFATEAAARTARVRVEPLYDGYEWAVSSRWDDNNPADEELRDVLTRHGHRGTFYLNSLWRDWSEVTPTVDSAFGRNLLRGGHSLGGHSLTHPLLSYCNRNRIFEETAGVRMVWEAAADTPVVSYAFSYCNFTNPQEGDVVHAAIARALERGGFYHVASEPQFEQVRTALMLSPIMPADGQEIDPHVEVALASESFKEEHPNLTYSMHAWYRTPEAWAKFEGQLDKYGHRPNWWYCNQNEYGAYRYQFRRSRLAAPAHDGRTLRLRLTRPVLLDLNDAIPLTFVVEGVPREAVTAATCPTAQCRLAERADGPFRFHLLHDREQALPEKIGLIRPNTSNRQVPDEGDEDADFPGLRALLSEADGRLRLTLENGTAEPLTDLRVTYRLPPAYEPGVVRHRLDGCSAGARRTDRLMPTLARDDYKHRGGSVFFAAQVDYRLSGRPGRLHTACHGTPTERDASYPQGGFLRLGPIPEGQVDLGRLTEEVRTAQALAPEWILPDDTRLTWQADDDPARAPWLDVELTRVSGIWFQDKPGTYVLQSVLRSPTAQPARLRFLRGSALGAFLNGQPVAEGQAVELRAGDNPLRLVVPQQVGFFLQVLHADRDERLTDIRFEQPAVGAERAYVPAASGIVSRKTLTGPWRARLTQTLPPAPSMDAAYPDHGISEAARALLGPEVDDSGWEELAVPGRWLDYPGEWARIDGEAVFRRVVRVPDEWLGRELILSLGPIDDFDETYLNGVLIGRTDQATPEFYAVPRRYAIPAGLARAGGNILAVRIFDHFGDGGFTGAPQDLSIEPR